MRPVSVSRLSNPRRELLSFLVCKLVLGSNQFTVCRCAFRPLLLGFSSTCFFYFSVILTLGPCRYLKCTYKCCFTPRGIETETQRERARARERERKREGEGEGERGREREREMLPEISCEHISLCRAVWLALCFTWPFKSPRRLLVYFSCYCVAGYLWSRLLQCTL